MFGIFKKTASSEFDNDDSPSKQIVDKIIISLNEDPESWIISSDDHFIFDNKDLGLSIFFLTGECRVRDIPSCYHTIELDDKYERYLYTHGQTFLLKHKEEMEAKMKLRHDKMKLDIVNRFNQ